MASLIVRKIEDRVVRRLREYAVREGISMEEAHRRILRKYLMGKEVVSSFKEYIQSMPEFPNDALVRRSSVKRQQIDL